MRNFSIKPTGLPQQIYNMKSLPLELVQAACYACDPKICKEFIENGFDINTQDEDGATILMYAVQPDRFGDINSPESILKLVTSFLEQGAYRR